MKKQLLILFALLFSVLLFAQTNFKAEISIKTTPVKNQNNSGTCWSFATTSFIETELLRIGKGEFDLSEMYFVYHAYLAKADNYIRLKGLANFGEGGQAHDVMNVILIAGIMPETAYTGLTSGDTIHDHGKMSSYLLAILKEIVKQDKPDAHRTEILSGILNTCLGKPSDQFEFKGKKYSPQQFSKDVIGLNPDDYIELTSFSHHPYYAPFRLEIPDNWSGAQYYNVTMEDLIKIMHYALKEGYSVCWDGDVTEKNFKHKKSYADIEKGEKVTVENRQMLFDNFQTTDDHLMHIIGTAKDENGKIYFTVKNSWGTRTNETGGLLYMSEDFAALKTVAIMVHKNAIPKETREKLGIR